MERWIEAFNERDLAKLLALYSENARHYSPRLKEKQPGTLGWVMGKKELGKWWLEAFEGLPGLRYDLEVVTENREKGVVLLAYTRVVGGEKSKVVEYFKLGKEGLIEESRGYLG